MTFICFVLYCLWTTNITNKHPGPKDLEKKKPSFHCSSNSKGINSCSKVGGQLDAAVQPSEGVDNQVGEGVGGGLAVWTFYIFGIKNRKNSSQVDYAEKAKRIRVILR